MRWQAVLGIALVGLVTLLAGCTTGPGQSDHGSVGGAAEGNPDPAGAGPAVATKLDVASCPTVPTWPARTWMVEEEIHACDRWAFDAAHQAVARLRATTTLDEGYASVAAYRVDVRAVGDALRAGFHVSKAEGSEPGQRTFLEVGLMSASGTLSHVAPGTSKDWDSLGLFAANVATVEAQFRSLAELARTMEPASCSLQLPSEETHRALMASMNATVARGGPPASAYVQAEIDRIERQVGTVDAAFEGGLAAAYRAYEARWDLSARFLDAYHNGSAGAEDQDEAVARLREAVASASDPWHVYLLERLLERAELPYPWEADDARRLLVAAAIEWAAVTADDAPPC